MRKLFWIMCLAVILFAVLASPNLIGADAVFEVTDLVISPSQINKGESANISFMVTNTGNITGSYSLDLKINGVVEATETVELGAGENKRLTFTITKDTPGEYSVEVGDLKGSLKVIDAVFYVTDLTTSTEQINEGESITITVDVINVGSERGKYNLWLKLNRELTIDAKESQTVSFIVIGNTLGKQQFEIADLKGEYSVVEAPTVPPPVAPPTPQVVPPWLHNWWQNWWLIGSIAGAIILILIVVIVIMSRRQY